MDKKRESLQSKIERLRKSFFTELPGRLDEIEKDFQELKLNPEDSKVQSELHRKIHNIKGTAASFGLKGLSHVAVKTETKLKAILESSISADELMLANIHTSLQQLRLQAEQANDKGSSDEPTFPAFELSPENLGNQSLQENQLVYICDDDKSLLENLQIQLSCFAYSTRIFTEPQALLDAVKIQVPDVIIMDIVFPAGEQTGIDCIKQLQKLQEEKIPVIFVSARNDFQARLHAVQAGGSAYFSKPLKVMDLVDSIDSIFTAAQPEPHRILVIDDDIKVAEYHSLILQEAGMSVRIINDAKLVLDVIFDYKPDLILMDMYMPICNGCELAQLIRQIPEFLSLPIVYLSSETDAKRQFSALRVGADGFLTKAIEPERLISEVLLRTERMNAIRSLMVKDSLTGLLNHTTILSSLDAAMVSAKRNKKTLCFAMLDIDHFKQVNDTHGHAVGDQVLLALSRILKQRLRKSDFVGRYGGEEFALVMPDVSLTVATKIVGELRDAFHNITFNSELGEFSCSLSGGVSVFPVFDNIQDLVNSADQALYRAKNSGRNRIIRADHETEKRTEKS